MAEVGLGQLVTTTGRARSRVLKDSVSDNHPVMAMMKETKGIKREDGGRTIIQENKAYQNPTVGWVGESGQVPLSDVPVIDSPEFDWKYLLGSVVFTIAERLKNSGGSDTKFIDLIAGKFEVLEDTSMNIFHSGLLSNGTGAGGLQLGGLALLVSKTPTTGTVGGINRANADAAWFRNQAFNTATDWTNGSVNAGNVKAFLDKGINSTTRGTDKPTCGLMGQTHWEALTSALQAMQIIQNESGTGKAGFDKMVYRGVPIFYGGGISFSGEALVGATDTYLLNTKPNYINITFHKQAEFTMLEELQSFDQAVISRLMFTMANMVLGFAKGQWVGFD